MILLVYPQTHTRTHTDRRERTHKNVKPIRLTQSMVLHTDPSPYTARRRYFYTQRGWPWTDHQLLLPEGKSNTFNL